MPLVVMSLTSTMIFFLTKPGGSHGFSVYTGHLDRKSQRSLFFKNQVGLMVWGIGSGVVCVGVGGVGCGEECGVWGYVWYVGVCGVCVGGRCGLCVWVFVLVVNLSRKTQIIVDSTVPTQGLLNHRGHRKARSKQSVGDICFSLSLIVNGL